MTQEAKIVFDVSDIVNIRITCANPACRGETMCPLNADYKIPSACPYCGDTWERNGSDTPQKQLVTALRRVRNLDNPLVLMKFEMSTEFCCEKP